MIVQKEKASAETRVALVPDAVGPLVKAGLDVIVEKGAGALSLASDSAYVDAGATLVSKATVGAQDVLVHVRPLTPAEAKKLKPGTITVGLCAPASELETVKALRDASVTSFAMELVPRISRAQSMDALTSQALVAGYRCVLEAAMRLPRFFPLFMTAAGTVPPAKVVVLGAGVAGLQAIATAKRLGAVVSAYDVRPASADEVKSMGASFITLDLESLEGAGGYAREMTEDRAARQRELLAPYIAEADVVITTAAVPGRTAPLLMTQDMVAGMKSGSVVVDLAAETGGNVAGTVAGKDVSVKANDGGLITIVGMKDAACTMPVDASRLYAKNIANLIMLMTKDGAVSPDFDDEVVAGACLTHAGEVRHEPTAELLSATGAKKAPAKKAPAKKATAAKSASGGTAKKAAAKKTAAKKEQS